MVDLETILGKHSECDTQGHDLAAKEKIIVIIWHLYAFEPNNKRQLDNYNKI